MAELLVQPPSASVRGSQHGPLVLRNFDFINLVLFFFEHILRLQVFLSLSLYLYLGLYLWLGLFLYLLLLLCGFSLSVFFF